MTFTVTVSDDYSDGGMVAYVQVDGTTVCGPLEDDGSTSTTCDVTIYAGEVMEVSAECDYYDYPTTRAPHSLRPSRSAGPTT